MDGNSISGWSLSQKQGEEENIEGYLKAWDAIKDLDIGPSHVNLAAEIANRFMSGGHYANMVHFVNGLDEPFLQKLKDNEKFVRALIALRMTQRKYDEVFSLLESGRFSNKEGLLEMWDEAHYREWEERMGKPLNALLRYRIRQRFLPPQHICPNGTRPTTRLPDQALKILKEWLMQHPKDPYPTKIDKEQLMKNSGLSLSQVKTWFANARRRLRLKKEKGDVDGSEASSDSPEDALPGEEGGPVLKREGEELMFTKSEIDHHRVEPETVHSGFAFSQTSTPYNVSYASEKQSGTREIGKSETWPVSKPQTVYPTVSSAGNQVQLLQTGGASNTCIPCPFPHTSQYLKAMAGMCEQITPATYHLGGTRQPRSPLCSSISELHSLQHSRSQSCTVLQDESYPYLPFQKHTSAPEQCSMYPSISGASFHGDAIPLRTRKWYQGHDNQGDPRLMRSYSVSAPPALGSLSTASGHLGSGLSEAHPGPLADSAWSTYPQHTYSEPYVASNAQCTRCKPQVTSHHQVEGGRVPDTSFQRPLSSPSIPIMRHDQLVSPHSEQNSYVQWRSNSEHQRLPAFHTSFDLHKLPLSAMGYQHSREQSLDTSLRLQEEHFQSSHALMSAFRRRHKSQPATSSPRSAPNTLTFATDIQRQLLGKRTSQGDIDTKDIKNPKITECIGIQPGSTSGILLNQSREGVANDRPAHLRPAPKPTLQTTPPHAHVHQKPNSNLHVNAMEPFSSTSVAPSLTTHTQANTTESRDGMKEVALVLLDLSTKCSSVDPRT